MVIAGESFGQMVRRMRLVRRLTQEQLAQRADLDQSTISQIELDKAKHTLGTVSRLASAFGEEAQEWIYLAGLMPRPDLPAGVLAPPAIDDDAIVADLFEQFRAIAPPEALDVLRQMKENETPEVYRQALIVLVEAFAANAKMGTRMMRMGGE